MSNTLLTLWQFQTISINRNTVKSDYTVSMLIWRFDFKMRKGIELWLKICQDIWHKVTRFKDTSTYIYLRICAIYTHC